MLLPSLLVFNSWQGTHVSLRAVVERDPSEGARSGSTGPTWASFLSSALSLPATLAYLFKGRLVDPLVRASNEAGLNSSPSFSEAAGVVSTARIERPLLHRVGSASTETMSAASPSPSDRARSASRRTTRLPFLFYYWIAESRHSPSWIRMKVQASPDSVGISSLPSTR